jgi:hypothetical protein
MRILGLVLAGAVALTVTAAAQAGPRGSATMRAGPGPAPGIVQIWDGNHPSWRQGPGPGLSGQWNGRWLPPRWRAVGPPVTWGLVPGAGVPTYWVWAPGTAFFDYPFADWRGPTGGWGNP